VHPRRMTALVVAGTIVAGTGAWALARVVDVTSTPPTARTAPIRAVAVESPSEAPSTTTTTRLSPAPAFPLAATTHYVSHPALRRTSVAAEAQAPAAAEAPAPAPEVKVPVVVAPLAVVPPATRCDDSCGATHTDDSSSQRSTSTRTGGSGGTGTGTTGSGGTGSGGTGTGTGGTGTGGTGTGGTGTGTHQDN